MNLPNKKFDTGRMRVTQKNNNLDLSTLQNISSVLYNSKEILEDNVDETP
jgi:hypothetical protein